MINAESANTDPTMIKLQLERLAVSLQANTYPGYPAFADRLFKDSADFQRNSAGRLMLPQGPWDLNNHPNQEQAAISPSINESVQLAKAGYELDNRNRPLHPWLEQMIGDAALGVVTGRGFYRQWGPNQTADPIVVSGDQILLIQRGDTKQWALPGGFVDSNETGEQAARRETREETGVVIPDSIQAEPIYKGPIADIRVTANAWAETAAYLFRLPGLKELPTPNGADDAIDALWQPLDQVIETNLLLGPHSLLAKLARQRIDKY